MKHDHARAPAPMLAAIFILACVPAGAETLVVSADRMFDARDGKITGPARVVVRDGLIAVAGNPLDEIAVMEDVRFVMKAGVVYKD